MRVDGAREVWDIITMYRTHESIPTSIFMPLISLKELLVIKRMRRARARARREGRRAEDGGRM